MTNPTSNFGWQMPESTDLVTNLPADFEVFGQAVDTDFADLLGGTTGQVLSKTSNTDLDFTWIANDQGDITGVTAGTGISGGGTSGTVTVTNSMATAIDAKGDLVAGTGADAFSRLAVGTNGYLLTADSAEATGLKWAAPAGGGGKVLQVVYSSYATETTSASGTFATTNLTANITPSLNTSKVLILVNQSGCLKYGSSTGLYLRLKRNSTVISNFERTAGDTGSSATNGVGSCSTSVLDAPATTSSITYATEFASKAGSGTVVVNTDAGGITTLSTIILMEIGA